MTTSTLPAATSTWQWLQLFWELNIDRFLLVGWSILAVLTIIASLGMLLKLIKPRRGLQP